LEISDLNNESSAENETEPAVGPSNKSKFKKRPMLGKRQTSKRKRKIVICELLMFSSTLAH
jgi:hypothetical protein